MLSFLLRRSYKNGSLYSLYGTSCCVSLWKSSFNVLYTSVITVNNPQVINIGILITPITSWSGWR